MSGLVSPVNHFAVEGGNMPEKDIVCEIAIYPAVDLLTPGSIVIEIDLRQPSMLHGKKGFERIVWAFKNVLNHSVAWLFYDLESPSGGMAEGLCSPEPIALALFLISDINSTENKPIKNIQPQIIECNPVRITHHNILTPAFQETAIPETASQEDLQDECGSLSEWIAMVSIESPRVLAEDNVDSYLSRYCIPDAERAKPSNLVSLKWHGFAPAKWVMQLFFELL